MRVTHPSQDGSQRWIMEAEKWQDKIPEASEFLKKVNSKTRPFEK